MTRTAPRAESPHPTREIPLAEILESPRNPRTVFLEIEELAASMKANGQIEPAVVRPHPAPGPGVPPFELVVGARRIRAARLAGMTTLRCEVRILSDKEALELSLTENDQRYPVHPLDESEAYRRLHEEHESSLEEIATKAGRPENHIRQRLQLVRLCEPGRALFKRNAVQLAGAFMIARLPLVELQVQLCEELRRMHTEDEAAIDSWRIRKLIEERYLTVLASAPWPKKLPMVLADGTGLVACSACPKRTGAQAELWEELATDLCTDALCFAKKKARYFEQVQERLKKDGNTVLDAKTSRAYFLGAGPTLTTGAPYLDLDAPLAIDGKGRTLRALVGKVDKSLIVGALDGQGAIHELVAKSEVPKLLAAAGHAQMGESAARVLGPARVSVSVAQSEEMKANVYRVAVASSLDVMLEQVARKVPGLELWSVLITGLLGMLSRDAQKRVCERRAWKFGGATNTPADAIERARVDMNEKQARGLVLELAIMQGVVKGAPSAFEDAREMFGVDWAKEQQKARKTLKLPTEGARRPAAKKPTLDDLADDDEADDSFCCEVMMMASSKRTAAPDEVLTKCPACDALGMQIEEVIAEGAKEGYLTVTTQASVTAHMVEGGEGVVGQHGEGRVAGVMADLIRRKRVWEDGKGVLHTHKRAHAKKFEQRGAVKVRVG